MSKAGLLAEERVVRSASAADRLARRLQNAIDRGKFAFGTSLPSERELMIKYEVSRPTVREALRVLSAQGLIQVKRGRSGGSFISRPSANAIVRSLNLFIKGQNIRFIDLIFVREAIEPAAAAQAALSRTEQRLEQLRLQCVACENALDNVKQFAAANLKWHLAVADASNNPLFVTFLTSISSALHIATDLEVFDFKTRKAVVGVHWKIYEAIRLRDPEAARRRMTRHLSAYGEKLTSADLPAGMRANMATGQPMQRTDPRP